MLFLSLVEFLVWILVSEPPRLGPHWLLQIPSQGCCQAWAAGAGWELGEVPALRAGGLRPPPLFMQLFGKDWKERVETQSLEI